MPEYLEARNSGISLELLRQNVFALEQYYKGNSSQLDSRELASMIT